MKVYFRDQTIVYHIHSLSTNKFPFLYMYTAMCRITHGIIDCHCSKFVHSLCIFNLYSDLHFSSPPFPLGGEELLNSKTQELFSKWRAMGGQCIVVREASVKPPPSEKSWTASAVIIKQSSSPLKVEPTDQTRSLDNHLQSYL